MLGDDSGPTVDVLYVGGMPRSGSTLTDLMLDGLPGHTAVGELFYLWRNGLDHDGLCSCGAVFSRCPFWMEVGARAFGGWDNVDSARVLELQDSVDRTGRIPAILGLGASPAFRRDLADYRDILRSLYRAVAEVSGAQVVVDSSKRPSLAFVLRATPGVRLTVAHVVRDPRGVAHSFGKHVDLPPGAALKSQMPRSSNIKVSRRWVTVNLLITVLSRWRVRVVRIRYEDLVREPARELTRILRAEGLAPAGEGFPFLTADGIVVGATHVVAGGRIRLAGGAMALRLDEGWRTDMPPRRRQLVGGLTCISRLFYGYR